jgi:hypothetical protein
MFERGRIDRPGDVDKTPHSILVTLDDGSEIAGRVLISATKTLLDELNNPSAFLEFETFAGERSLIAKRSLRSVMPMRTPRADQLAQRLRAAEGFDPHQVLGIDAGADRDTIRAAYHRLAKLYHPDRYNSLDLPEEVAAYLSSMARRLNAAHALLDGQQKTAAKASAEAAAHA